MWGRKWLIGGGMAIQGMALLGVAAGTGFTPWLIAGVLLGIGTAMVYPTLIAAISDVAHPAWRGSAVGVYRFWRDIGYAIGAVAAGVLADAFGISTAIAAVGIVTLMSAGVVAVRIPETAMSRLRATGADERFTDTP